MMGVDHCSFLAHPAILMVGVDEKQRGLNVKEPKLGPYDVNL